MKTPIADFVRRYAASGTARFHMPGHKGVGPLGCEALDLTEIAGADDLFAADGVIAESERNAAALFGAGHTFYSAEGATLAIKAMLALAAQEAPKGGRPRVLAARNAHRSFLYACGLLDLDVTWLIPAVFTHLCSCPVTPAEVEATLKEAETGRENAQFCAVYLTSPDYLGNLADVAGIAAVCRAHGVPLLVDNAHGAYLAFTDPARHPLSLGAAMTADSAHKTLPVLTGGAYLHIAKDAPAAFAEGAREATALFASSSPSYLILQSLDLCNRTLAGNYPAQLADCAALTAALGRDLAAHGYAVCGDEPIKITLSGAPLGYTGNELAETLREAGAEPEFADRDFVVLMCAPHNAPADFGRVRAALTALPRREHIAKTAPVAPPAPQKALSIREALLAPRETLSPKEAVGRVCAAPAVSCPPAVPIVMSGEVITAEAAELFAYYGIRSVHVVK